MYSAPVSVTTAISFAICPLLAYLISRKYYKIRYDLLALVKLAVVALAIYIAGTAWSIDNVILAVSLKLALIGIAPVLLYVVGYFDAKELSFLAAMLQ